MYESKKGVTVVHPQSLHCTSTCGLVVEWEIMHWQIVQSVYSEEQLFTTGFYPQLDYSVRLDSKWVSIPYKLPSVVLNSSAVRSLILLVVAWLMVAHIEATPDWSPWFCICTACAFLHMLVMGPSFLFARFLCPWL